MGVVAAAIFVVGGLLFLARLLLQKPPGAPDGLGEDDPSLISTRGAWIPVYYGTRITARTVIGWAGNRTTTKESVGGGGGKGGGGGGDVKQTIYFEEVWHQLGVGPATTLHEIRFNGKIVWQGPINSTNTPSGTEIDLGKEGTFRIFWGEADQPVNTDLGDASRIGVTSRWPRLCYIYWTKMRYGTSPSQPQVQYVLTWNCPGITLTGSDYFLSDTVNSVLSTGINPGHIAHILLNSGNFLGSGIDKSEIDNATLEGWGTLAQTEHFPVNVAYVDGPSVERAIQALLQDMGYQMPLVDGRLTFLEQRFEDMATFPVLSDDEVAPPDVERTIDLTPNRITRPVFTFKSEQGFNFRDQDVPFNDDGDADAFGLATASRVGIDTVTNLEVASRVARRRWQESTIKSDIKIRALRGARLITPGQALIKSPLGQLRVIGSKWSDETAITELSCSLDSYAVPDIDDVLTIPDPGGGQQDPAPDIAFAWFELPPEQQSGNTIEIVVIRIRAHQQIFTAGIFLSTDATTYTGVGDQTHGQGGLLEEAMLATPADLVVEGPRFEPDNDDITEVLDLSSDVTAWQSGKQVAIINDEVFFVESFVAVNEMDWVASTAHVIGDFVRPTGAPNNLRFRATTAGTTGGSEPTWPTEVGETVNDNGIVWEAHRIAFYPRNMIRARYDTVAAAHAIGDRIFVADADELTAFTQGGFTAGQQVCVKTQPRTSGGAVDLAIVTPVCDLLEGDPASGIDIRVTDSGPRVTAIGDQRITG